MASADQHAFSDLLHLHTLSTQVTVYGVLMLS